MANSSRAKTKERLKQNVVGPDTRIERKPERSRLPLILIIAGVLAAVICILFVVRQRIYNAEGYGEVWSKDVGSVGVTFRGYTAFNDGVIMYSKDGAEYIDRKGTSIWQRSYQMSDPVCEVCGKFAVVADKGGTSFYIFSDTGNTGDASTTMPISKVAVSEKGLVYAVLSDNDAGYIYAYRKDGTPIDISVKSVLNGDGYPYDIACSPSGEQLLTSYISINDSDVKESLVFRNFGTVGQENDAKRVVGGFMDEFEDHIVTDVAFANNEKSHAFYDGGIAFFSTKVLNSPELLSKVEIEETILSITDSTECTAIITEKSGNDSKKTLLIYDNNGIQTGMAEFNLNYTGFTAGKKNVVVYDQDDIFVYSLNGRRVATLSYDGKITSLSCTDGLREFIISESGRVVRIKAS
ncbi:MAG: DUF5711 family protein [Eubacteriales bacterium]|nr:DUF5711 family protein [Eubacteriales bacterium]